MAIQASRVKAIAIVCNIKASRDCVAVSTFLHHGRCDECVPDVLVGLDIIILFVDDEVRAKIISEV